MSHKHHSCDCEHESVKYCKKCKLVHCLDCNLEWRNYSNWTYTYNYPYSITSGGIGQAKNINVASDGHWNNVETRLLDGTSCQHEAKK